MTSATDPSWCVPMKSVSLISFYMTAMFHMSLRWTMRNIQKSKQYSGQVILLVNSKVKQTFVLEVLCAWNLIWNTHVEYSQVWSLCTAQLSQSTRDAACRASTLKYVLVWQHVQLSPRKEACSFSSLQIGTQRVCSPPLHNWCLFLQQKVWWSLSTPSYYKMGWWSAWLLSEMDVFATFIF